MQSAVFHAMWLDIAGLRVSNELRTVETFDKCPGRSEREVLVGGLYSQCVDYIARCIACCTRSVRPKQNEVSSNFGQGRPFRRSASGHNGSSNIGAITDVHRPTIHHTFHKSFFT